MMLSGVAFIRAEATGCRQLLAITPCPGAVALQLMHAPAGWPANAAHVGCRDQHREDVAQPPHEMIAEFPAVVVFDEAQQAPVPDAPNVHAGMYAVTVQLSRARVQRRAVSHAVTTAKSCSCPRRTCVRVRQASRPPPAAAMLRPSVRR